MRLLLDTHAFLWFVGDDPQLSSTARSVIEDGNNEVLLSKASVWEIAIKVSIGKMMLIEPIDSFIPNQLRANNIHPLAINLSHIYKVATLPFHHKDPFDRLLIAQSVVESIPPPQRRQPF